MFVPDNPRLAALTGLIEAEDYQHAISTAHSQIANLLDHPSRDRADCFFCLAFSYMQINDAERSIEFWQAAEEEFTQIGDADWALRSAAGVARVTERVGDLERSLSLSAGVIARAQEEGFPYPLNYARLIRGYAFLRGRDYEHAEPLFTAAEPYFRQWRDESMLLRCMEGMAWIMNAAARREEARLLETQILEMQRGRTRPIELATSLLAVGFGAWLDGDIDRMCELLEEALLIASAHKHERLLTSIHNNFAIAHVELQDWAAVRRHASLALLHAGRSGDNRRPPLAYGLQMHLALYESRPGDAAQYADESVFALREHTSPEARQYVRWRPLAHLAAGSTEHAILMWDDAPPFDESLEQYIQLRWMRRLLLFLASPRFRPDEPLDATALRLADQWQEEIAAWLAADHDFSIPDYWRGP